MTTSDDRLKDIIEPITGAMAKVRAIDGFIYNWNNTSGRRADENTPREEKTRYVGVSAQAVQAVLPEVVDEGLDGYLGVSYSKLVPLLIEAIKELEVRISELEDS
jgi:hypothetical protein